VFVTPAAEAVGTAKENTRQKATNDTNKNTGRKLLFVPICSPPLKKLSEFLMCK
jgi:hypothetical protein